MTQPDSDPELDPTQLEVCLRVLEAARALEPSDPRYVQLERAAAHLVKSAKVKRRAQRRRDARARDRALVEQATTFAPQAVAEQPAAATLGKLHNQRCCYVCKAAYRQVDARYHQLCPACAEENAARREARVDLSGRRALVTGGRIKIGYWIALKLLRDGAQVTITTRFPHDAARRFAAEADFDTWGERLKIVGIDLRHLGEVGRLLSDLEREPSLNVLINNAAQTVRRPAGYYAELAEGERAPLPLELQALVPGGEAPHLPATVDEAPLERFLALCRTEADPRWFPAGERDASGQQLDLRPTNSWTQLLADVEPLELLEVQVVNAVVPFLLSSRLKPLLLRSPFADRYLIQVSAVEGQFAYANKTPNHPHTNMAKAALNMLTRTAAQDYARDGIYMCSVDTGWVTDENPHPKEQRMRASGFSTPLDVIDGAARVYDPIVRGVGGAPVYGCFLKDYREVPW